MIPPLDADIEPYAIRVLNAAHQSLMFSMFTVCSKAHLPQRGDGVNLDRQLINIFMIARKTYDKQPWLQHMTQMHLRLFPSKSSFSCIVANCEEKWYRIFIPTDCFHLFLLFLTIPPSGCVLHWFIFHSCLLIICSCVSVTQGVSRLFGPSRDSQ